MAKRAKLPEYGRCRMLQAWPEWDCSVHADVAQIDRQERAMNYPFSFEIDSETKTARFSSTSDLSYYDTTLASCTCHDFEDRHLPCKHIYRLAAELGIIEIFRRKPGGQDKDLLESVKNSSNIDEHPEQLKRIEKARETKCAPLSIDFDNRMATFGGSGKVPYETTVDTCTCRDYFVRRLPCKHIYRLRIELGLTGGDNGKK